MAEMDHDAGYGGSVGERLRQARERRGLSLDDVATQTRIPIRHLSNIEQENWGELPSVTYTVGFTRSYANAVGLDGAEIGRELREQLGGETRPSRVSPEIYAPPDPARVPSRSLAWIAGIALIVLIAVWLLIVRPYLTRSDDDTAEAAPAAEQPVPAPAQQQAQPQQQAPQNLAGQQVVLVATGPVWFQVNDRAQNNRRIHTGELAAGQTYQIPLDAQQPVIRTGRPQVLTVRIGNRELGPLAPAERMISNVSLLPNDLAQSLGGQQQPGAQPAPAGNSGFRPTP